MGYGVAMSTRSYRHLSAEDRETLSVGLAHGHSLRMMARVLGRAPSTISRESARNPREAIPIAPVQHRHGRLRERVSRDARANSWIPGSGST